MSLVNDLARARTEEDVKDAYIKALGLKGYSKNLVDIQTEEVWFEAKDSPKPSIEMFAQLLFYIRAARKRGEAVPAFLSVVDRAKAALMPTEKALPLLDDKSIVWPKSGSSAGHALAAQIAPYVQTHIIEYDIAHDAEAFVKAVRDAIRERRIIRTPITPDNLRQVFDRWADLVGNELGVANPTDLAVLFFADIMHDGNREAMNNLPARLLMTATGPVFLLDGVTYELASRRGYDNFWAIYHRPPEQKHRHYLLERRDSLLPVDEQKFKGAYYTPLHIVDRAYDQLLATLGPNWQDRYIVWDMCAGVGNLEAKHSNLRNVFMSTLDQADVTIMKSNPAFAGAEIFQYDYLNDDINDFGDIDYGISNKVPQALREAIANARAGKSGAKPILVLINPPYGEAANAQGNAGKAGISVTRLSNWMSDLGYASRELFVQFLHRIKIEIPHSKVAVISKLKYINSPNFSEFQSRWTARFLGGFVMPSKVFDGLKGSFPIGFLIWDLKFNEPIDTIETVVLDRAGHVIGEKQFLKAPVDRLLSGWLPRLRATGRVVPLTNAITPKTGHAKVSTWHEGSLGHMLSNANDLQHASTLTALYSSVCSQGNGYYVTAENLWKAAIVFSVRRLIKPTWLNDRDQFLQPSEPLTDEFKSDCLVWMLFNGSNLSAGADGLRWDNRDWSLTNHFIPFTEAQVGANGRFESNFMARYTSGASFSTEGRAVLDEGLKLWQRFHAIQFPRKIREEFKLGRPDAGWYQIRRSLEAYSETELTDFEPFRRSYAVLSAKLRPMVFDLGFLAK